MSTVVNCAVIGMPDPVLGTAPCAFLVMRDGVTGAPALLQTHMKWRYTEAKISPTNAAQSSADAAQILSSVFPTAPSAAPPHFPHASLDPSPSSHEMEITKRTPPTKAQGRVDIWIAATGDTVVMLHGDSGRNC